MAALGKLFKRKELVFKKVYGEAKVGDFNFDIILVNCAEPGVFCRETGKTFHLTWDEIVKLAIKARVTDDD